MASNAVFRQNVYLTSKGTKLHSTPFDFKGEKSNIMFVLFNSNKSSIPINLEINF